MTVLKYSDLADSGLYVKVSTKGVANGVASLGSDGKVPSIQLPDGLGGGTAGVSSFNGRTGTVTLIASDVPSLDASKITSGIIDAARLPPGGTTGGSTPYTFRVDFIGSNPGTISEVPVGWTVSASGSFVNVTHNSGKIPKFVTYLGYNSGSYFYRFPTLSDQLSMTEANKLIGFTISLPNDIAGTQQGGHAYVSIIF